MSRKEAKGAKAGRGYLGDCSAVLSSSTRPSRSSRAEIVRFAEPLVRSSLTNPLNLLALFAGEFPEHRQLIELRFPEPPLAFCVCLSFFFGGLHGSSRPSPQISAGSFL